MPAERAHTQQLIERVLSESHTWSERPTAETLGQLPGQPAVYLLLASRNVPVQLATTQHLRRLITTRLLDEDRAARGQADLAEITRGVRWRVVTSPFEAQWRYYHLARELYPRRYRRMVSFSPAWFLRVDWSDTVPDLEITQRVWEVTGDVIGPWLTRDTCQKALDGLRDLFDLCRYPEQVRRAPQGQRCAYADMGRCDAPCDGSVPLDTYFTRLKAACAFAAGHVRPWIDVATGRMKKAAQEQRFEQAGLLKKQIAWAWRWFDTIRPVISRRECFNRLLLVPVTRRRAWKVFLFWQGDLLEGPVLQDRQLARVAEWLGNQFRDLPLPPPEQVRTEQTWLLAHFLHSRLGDASIIEPLPERVVPAELTTRLEQAVADRRAAAEGGRADSDGTDRQG